MRIFGIAALLMAMVLLLTFALAAQEARGQPNSEILRDKYILGLSRALKGNDYPRALKFIDRLEKLGGDLPPAIDYFRGEAYFHTKRYGEAQRALNRYVEKTGRKGRYYWKSLELMLVVGEETESERRRPGRRTGAVSGVARGRGSGGGHTMQISYTVTLRYFERREALIIIGAMADEFPGYKTHTIISREPAVRRYSYLTSAKPHKMEEWLTILLRNMNFDPDKEVVTLIKGNEITIEKILPAPRRPGSREEKKHTR